VIDILSWCVCQAVDAIYHMVRSFEGEVTHVEGDVEPIRYRPLLPLLVHSFCRQHQVIRLHR
jgi:hypothetical protein